MGGPGHGLRVGNNALGPISLIEDLLDDDQIAAIQAIHEDFRTQIRALMESYRAEQISREEFEAQLELLRAEQKAAVQAELTDEQLAELNARGEALREEREAERAERKEQEKTAMTDVLGLDEAQISALDELMTAHFEAIADLRDQVVSGDLTREEFQAAIDELRADRAEALEDLLSDEQYEIVRIHDALAMLGPHFARRGGSDGAGPYGGQGMGGPGSGHGGAGMGPGGGRG